MHTRTIILTIATLLLVAVPQIASAQQELRLTTSLSGDELRGAAYDDPAFLRSLAAHLKQDHLGKGYTIMRIAAERFPDDRATRNDLGVFAHWMGDEGLAEREFTAAIALDAEYQLARYNLATLLNLLERYDEAADHLEHLLMLDPNNPNYLYDLSINLALPLREQRMAADPAAFDRPIELLKRVERIEPGFANAAGNLAALEGVRGVLTAQD